MGGNDATNKVLEMAGAAVFFKTLEGGSGGAGWKQEIQDFVFCGFSEM